MTTDEIIFATCGPLAIATLNRPAALNVQNLAMVQAFTKQLTIWEGDPAITTLLIRGAGSKAFCAGGDVKGLWSEEPAARLAFFIHEYDLCTRLKDTRLVTVAYMDGITMGGGVGLSIYANHRVATPRTRWAMPEVRIGFFLDIAASHFLNHAVDPVLGRYLALTGAELSGAECLACGIATNFVSAGQGDTLAERLATGEGVAAVLRALVVPTPKADLPALDAAAVDLPLPDFLAHLSARGLLPDGLCSLSLKVVDEALRRGRTQDYGATVAMDHGLVRQFLAGDTFREGVRARLIDKDNKPIWAETGLDAIDLATVQAYFS